jgi:hypothetical protein
MTFTLAMTPPRLIDEIEEAISVATGGFDTIVAESLEVGPGLAGNRMPLAIKYMPARYASGYRGNNSGLRISNTLGFTWGTGVYVTPLRDPLSTALYGRAGIVARFDPRGWRIFDARDGRNRSLYRNWLENQPTLAAALLTVHSNFFLHDLRNFFREAFRIDCVLFHPDEIDRLGWYTTPADCWMAVADWNGAYLAEGNSTQFTDARLTVIVEEEFEADVPALTRSPYFALSGTGPPSAGLAGRIKTAYAMGTFERVGS